MAENLFAPTPAPKTPLGRYRVLGRARSSRWLANSDSRSLLETRSGAADSSRRSNSRRVSSREKSCADRGGNEQTEIERKYSEVLEEVGKEHNVDSVTAVALAYVMAKTPYVFPLVGGRKISHLHDNIRSLEIKLTSEQIAKIDSVQEFEHGFPSNFCGTDPTMNPIEGQPRNRLIAASGTLDFLPVRSRSDLLEYRSALPGCPNRKYNAARQKIQLLCQCSGDFACAILYGSVKSLSRGGQ